MIRLSKAVRPLSWFILILISGTYLFRLFSQLSYFDDTETLFFNSLRLHVLDSFRNGQLPVWNPIVGPGGSSVNFVAVNPWEYKTILYALFNHPKIYVLAQFLLILGAFIFAAHRLFQNRSAWFIGTLFLIYFNADTMPYELFRFGHSSLFIAYPLLLIAIYELERRPVWEAGFRPTAFFGLIFFLAHSMAFQGTQTVLWIFQLNCITLLTILAFRIQYGEPLIRNSRNILYLVSLVLSFGSNAWQLYWTFGNILESSRLNASYSTGTFSVVLEFLNSFHKSTYVTVIAILIFGKLALQYKKSKWLGVSKKEKYRRLAIGTLALTQILTSHWTWFLNDSLLFQHQNPLVGLSFIAILVWIWRWGRGGAASFKFEFTVLAMLLHYFLFDNAHWDNFGWREIERIPTLAFLLVFATCAFSLLSKEMKLRRAALFILFSIFLLRCHITLPLMRWTGFVWYFQRDGVYVSMGLAVLSGLGMLALFQKAPARWQPHWALGVLFLSGILYFQPTFRDVLWTPLADPKLDQKFHSQLLSGLPGDYAEKRLIAITSRATVSGTLMNDHVWQVNVYDSLVPHMTKTFLARSQEITKEKAREACDLPFIWFPNNIIRVLGCNKFERARFYQSAIGNFNYAVKDPDTFRRLGVKYFLTSHEVQTSFLKKIRETVHEGTGLRGILYEFPETVFHSFTFDDANNLCQEPFLGSPSSVKTNYFDQPMLKQTADFEFESSADGCLRLPVNFSRLWRVHVNGIKMEPHLVEEIFMGVPIRSGMNRIQITYLPWMKAGVLVSLLLCIIGVIFPFWYAHRVGRGVHATRSIPNRP